MDQLVLDGLALPVDDHGLGGGLAGNFDIEDRVVAGLGEAGSAKSASDPASTATGIVAGTIKHGGNLACGAHAARGILVELALAGLGYDNFWHFVFLVSLKIGHGKAAFSRQLSAFSSSCSCELIAPLPLLKPAC